jgi:hypothetical protein
LFFGAVGLLGVLGITNNPSLIVTANGCAIGAWPYHVGRDGERLGLGTQLRGDVDKWRPLLRCFSYNLRIASEKLGKRNDSGYRVHGGFLRA